MPEPVRTDAAASQPRHNVPHVRPAGTVPGAGASGPVMAGGSGAPSESRRGRMRPSHLGSHQADVRSRHGGAVTSVSPASPGGKGMVKIAGGRVGAAIAPGYPGRPGPGIPESCSRYTARVPGASPCVGAAPPWRSPCLGSRAGLPGPDIRQALLQDRRGPPGRCRCAPRRKLAEGACLMAWIPGKVVARIRTTSDGLAELSWNGCAGRRAGAAPAHRDEATRNGTHGRMRPNCPPATCRPSSATTGKPGGAGASPTSAGIRPPVGLGVRPAGHGTATHWGTTPSVT
jgi:hypothetical protein